MKRERRKVFCLLLLGIFVLAFLGSFLVSAGLEDEVDSASWYGGLFIFFQLGSTWKNVLMGIIIIAIIWAAAYDILELVGIFQNTPVKVIISAGIALAAALSGLVLSTAAWLLTFGATLGGIAIVIEVIVAIFIFFLLSLGNTWAAKFAAKRKGQMAAIKAAKGAASTVSAIKGLKKISSEFKRKK